MGVLPLLVGLFARALHLSWQQIGWLGAAQQAGTFAGTLLAYWLIGRRSLRLGIQLGALCALVFAQLTGTTESYTSLLWYRALTSVGVGCMFAIGTYLLSRSVVPARDFSIMSGVQVTCGSLHAVMLPRIHEHFGYTAAVASVAFWFAVILIVALVVPHLTAVEQPAVVVKPATRGYPSQPGTLRLLGSVIGFQCSVVMIWIFSERIATAAGMPPGQIATAIAIGSLGGILAGALGGWVGDRSGYIPMLFLATAAVVCGGLLMFVASSLGVYLGAHFVFNFGWMLGLSYYMGLLSKSDVGGRIVRLAPPSLVIAGALGPVCVATFTSGNSPMAILCMSFAFCGTALLLALRRRS
jgi:MFS family permease